MAGLSIRDARKSFGDTEVLKGVSIDVADGEFAVIVGPSGCGKSTLLRAVAGLEELDGGSIAIGERDVTANAYATQRGNTWIIKMSGGVAGCQHMTPDGVAPYTTMP